MGKLYEINYTYKGTEKKRYSLGNHSIKPNIPYFLYEEELPLPLRDIRKLKDLVIQEAKFVEKPNQKLVEAKVRGSKGIVWDGNSSVRTNNYGKFKRGEVNYSLSGDVVAYLATLPGFKVVE
jgi:hypothetical protein